MSQTINAKFIRNIERTIGQILVVKEEQYKSVPLFARDLADEE